ncbi:hypothetical protein [Streptomyces sp. NPDC050585]|uniref:hypothetical protein n=1 Tax=Streptomyces sp. NPDC050585 TaxID=3365632 RepID=UPI00378CCCD5
MILTVDPAIVAALIAASVAVLAAGAAYAAGRRQGLGAHHGAIDAVRRQHQRNAYADLLLALHNFRSATDVHRLCEQAEAELNAAGFDGSDNLNQVLRVCELIVGAAPAAPVLSALVVVELEGPAEVTEPLEPIRIYTERLMRRAQWTVNHGPDLETFLNLTDCTRVLELKMAEFSSAAQKVLNERPQ